jgi:AraC-like DNA-binding protein
MTFFKCHNFINTLTLPKTLLDIFCYFKALYYDLHKPMQIAAHFVVAHRHHTKANLQKELQFQQRTADAPVSKQGHFNSIALTLYKATQDLKLYIKNMVCHRCKMVVRAELEKLNLHPVNIALGEVLIEEKELQKEQQNNLSVALKAVGFELIDNRRSKVIEQIKTFVIDTIHYKEEQPKKKFSELISKHLHHDYSYLSNLFSEVEGITIEQYIINQRIEKVKELLVYDELSLSQIALDLGYSSTAHLSNQFKKLTGLTPSQFKQRGLQSRKSLDDVGKPK